MDFLTNVAAGALASLGAGTAVELAQPFLTGFLPAAATGERARLALRDGLMFGIAPLAVRQVKNLAG